MNSFKIVSTPGTDYAVTNNVYFNPKINVPEFIQIIDEKKFIYKTNYNDTVSVGNIGMNSQQRSNIGKVEGDIISFVPYMKYEDSIELITLQIDAKSKQEIDCKDLLEKIKSNLGTQILTVGQTYGLLFFGSTVLCTVEKIQNEDQSFRNTGMFNEDTNAIFFTNRPYIKLNNQYNNSGLFKKDMSLSKLGVGGLDKEFDEIFTKAFVSRVQPEIAEKMGISHVKGILLYGPPGCGKCLGYNTPVLMFDGSVKMVQDIEIGDKLMGDDSTERIVQSLARGKEQMYKIKQEDGDDYIVNESHILSLKMCKPKKLKKTKTSYKISYFSQKEFVYRKKTFNFADYKSKDDAFKEATKLLNSVETVENVDIGLQKYLRIQREPRRALSGYKVAVSFQKSELKYDPYVTGLLLAQNNAILEGKILSTEEMNAITEFVKEQGYNITFDSEGKLITSCEDFNKIINLTTVPSENKINSKNARIRFLAGIVDLKGDLYKRTFRFSTKNEEFAKDIVFMCRSLGFVVTSNTVILPDSKYIRIKFTGKLVTKMPTILERNVCTEEVKEKLTTTITVEKLGVDDYYGFEISGNRRFLLGDFTVTHNTLLARELGNLLNCHEPKIVNGPELLASHVGESEANVRKLFAEAEADKSGKLHVIILDEMDAICKQRGMNRGDTGVSDNVVNQILSKIDGVKKINNILIIGMTNRKDMIDEAILRPGRLELHIEVQLPDDKGREDILTIHTKQMRDNNFLGSDINLRELAMLTKNYTGAELASVARNASSFALSREIAVKDGQLVVPKKIKPMVTMEDLIRSANEIVPMFGRASNEIQLINSTPFIFWDERLIEMHDEILRKINSLNYGSMASILITGKSYIGKTKFVANVAKSTGIPCIKLVNVEKVFKSGSKSAYLSSIFDQCTKATNSILILDGFERLIEWLRIGPRFNNDMLQTIISVLTTQINPNKKITLICTANDEYVLDELGVTDLFDTKYVPFEDAITNKRYLPFPDKISNEQIATHFPTIYNKIDFGSEEDVSSVFKYMKYT